MIGAVMRAAQVVTPVGGRVVRSLSTAVSPALDRVLKRAADVDECYSKQVKEESKLKDHEAAGYNLICEESQRRGYRTPLDFALEARLERARILNYKSERA